MMIGGGREALDLAARSARDHNGDFFLQSQRLFGDAGSFSQREPRLVHFLCDLT